MNEAEDQVRPNEAEAQEPTANDLFDPQDFKDVETKVAGRGTSTLSGLGVTATASELNKLDGATLSTTELNYVDGVTSAIQTQIDDKEDKLLVAEYTFASSLQTITISDLDINADGGVYDFILCGNTSDNTPSMRFNGLSASNYQGMLSYLFGSLATSGAITPSGTYYENNSSMLLANVGLNASVLYKGTICLSNNRVKMNSSLSGILDGRQYMASNYWEYDSSITNLTSLYFALSGGGFSIGTTIKIYKRGE